MTSRRRGVKGEGRGAQDEGRRATNRSPLAPRPSALGPGTLAGVERALGKAPILRGLSAAQLRRIARKVEVREYPEGATIVAQDDTGRTLYVILQGRVKVVHHGEVGSAAAPLAEFGDGEFFGEMALLENATRSADVLATAPTTCALLSWELFLQDLLGNREVAIELLRTLSRRLRTRSQRLE